MEAPYVAKIALRYSSYKAYLQLKYSVHLCSETTVVVLYPFFLYPWEDGAKGLKRWFLMYITQIKPMEKGDYECALKTPLSNIK